MLKQAIPNVFVKDFQAALAYYTGPARSDFIRYSSTAMFPSMAM